MLSLVGSLGRSTPVRLFVIAALALVCTALILPGTVSAESSTTLPNAGEACASCHATETVAWQASPHAKAQVACETCHGPFTADHPAKKGSMKLEVESAGCQSCHSNTFAQWKASPHALKGVQCIGCHLSHSQKARLTDSTLCGSCHAQVLSEAAHGAHAKAGLSCIICHASAPGANLAPNHNFVVAADNCINCHGKTIHQFVVQSVSVTDQAVAVQAITDQLRQCEETNNSTIPLMLMNLGLGLGIGGLAGVVAVLGTIFVRERRTKQ